MFKNLFKKELKQLWLGPKTTGAVETPAYGQTVARQPRLNGAEDHAASGQGNGNSLERDPRDVLATARAASGM